MVLVSVIVPVYKVEKFLCRCVDSILNQTYSEFELILVDDGSPDDCPRMCDEYAKKDNRVRVIHQSNAGQSGARNAGLEVCKGDYIYFCDSDDWIEPDLLELAVEKIVSEDADMIRFQCFTHYDDISYTSSFSFCEDSMCLDNDEGRLDFICNSLLSYKIGWEMCLALYKANTLLTNNIRFPSGINIAEDLFINVMDTVYANKITFLDKPLYHYCMREDSTMGLAKGRIRLNACNELAYRLYQEIQSEFIKSHFYRIHNIMILNELMGNLPEIRNPGIAKAYLYELDQISYQDFFWTQLNLSITNIDYVTQVGFLAGFQKNAINNFLKNRCYCQYRLWMIFRDTIYFPTRAIRKIKRLLRIS